MYRVIWSSFLIALSTRAAVYAASSVEPLRAGVYTRLCIRVVVYEYVLRINYTPYAQVQHCATDDYLTAAAAADTRVYTFIDDRAGSACEHARSG